MTVPGKGSPGLAHSFSEPLGSELRKVWQYLKHLVIGPRWRLYERSPSDGLFIQVYDHATRTYKSVIRFNPSTLEVTYREDTSSTECMIHSVNQESVPAGYPVTSVSQPLIILPEACTLTEVRFAAQNVTGTCEADLYYWRGGVDQGTCLSGQVTISADRTTYSGTIATSSFQANDILQPRYVTGAGESFVDVKCTVKVTTASTTSGFGSSYDNIGVV